MTKITTKAIAKVAAVATGLGMATSLLSLAPMAHAAALTTDQVNSIISLLQSFGADSATIANVQASLTGGTPSTTTTTGSMSSSCSFTMDLHTGSSGAQVTCLQQALIAAGYSIPAGATGYFGSQTQAAVAAWQTAAGVSPAAGYFGPLSRAAWNLGGTTTGTGGLPAGCTSTSGYSSTTGQSCSMTSTLPAGCSSTSGYSVTTGQSCSGGTTSTGPLTGAGYLSQESSLGDVTSTLYAGDPATAVVGNSFVATGGDVQIQRVTATFDLSGVTTGSTNLDQYVSDVELWDGSTKLATMSASAGDESSSVWTFRFSGLTDVVKSGETTKLYIKVTPLSAISANQDTNGNFAGTMNAELLANSIQAAGADGISDTYGAAITQSFTVSSASSGTLTASPADDNPVAGLIQTASSTTTGVKLLSFNLKAKTSAATVKDLAIHLTTSDNHLNDVVNTVYLMKGSSVLKSTTLSTGTDQTVTFSNVNDTIAQDTTQNYTIVADLKGENTAYVDGTTLVASTTVAGWTVTDANGNSETPSAAVAGNTQTLSGVGMSVVMGTPSTSNNNASGASGGGNDIGTFKIPFTVTAGDNDVYIGGVAGTDITYATTTTSTTASTGQPTANFTASDSKTQDSAGVYYYVAAGSSRTFTLTATYTATATGYTGVKLTGIAYGSSSSLGSTFTSNLSTFKTDDIQLNSI